MLAESMRRISGLLQSGQYSAAHSQLESLVTANPDYVEGLRLFAGTKQALGDLAQAESLLRRALDIDPLWTPTLTTLAELLLMAGRSAEAVPLLQRAIRGSPQYLTQIEPRLPCQQKQGQTDESTDGCAYDLGGIAVLAE